MNRYMFAFTWQRAPDPSLAGDEHTRCTELIKAGKMEQLFLAEDRSRGWLVMLAGSEDEARQTVSTLPFFPCMHLEATPLVKQYP